MTKISIIALPLFLSFSALHVSAFAQGGSAKSYANARAAIEAGLNALGGLEAVRAAEDVTVTVSGQNFARNQSVKVDPPFDPVPTAETLFVNVSRQRYIFEQRSQQFGNDKTIISGGEAFSVDPTEKTIRTVSPASLPAITFNYIRWLPHLLLVYVREQRAVTMRHLGEETFEGRKHNVVTFANASGVQIALFFDAKTNLLSKYETMLSDPHDGDSVQETIFPGYSAVGGIKIPTGRIIKRNGEFLEDVKYSDARLNTRPPDSAFAKPEGYSEAPPFAFGEGPTRETKLADGVYLFESGVNSLVIEFKDHVIVVEPHMGGRGPKATISKVREIFPGKPIRNVILTHHHFDHSAGMRSYVAEGIPIVTTPANRRYLEQMAAANFTIAPDDQTKAKRTPAFAFVEGGKRVFTDDKQTVEVIDIGPGPHAQEMLIVYLPKEKLVFQGDLLRLDDDGKVTPDSIDDATLQFYDAMVRLGLDVQRIAGVHGGTATMEEFRKAVEKKRKGN